MLGRMHEPPASVQALIEDWWRRGSPRQPGVDWNRTLWEEKFPAYSTLFAELPVPLDRPAVQGRCEKLHCGAFRADEAFLLTMVWGYGVTGYGWWRTKRVLEHNADIGPQLTAVAMMLHTDNGAMLAYRALADDRRLQFLGPAFGTKFLYFCSASARHPALILDQLVAKWLRVNTTLSLDPVPWNSETYAQWLNHAYSWADSLHIRPDELESCVFEDQYNKQATIRAANAGRHCKTPASKSVHERSLL